MATGRYIGSFNPSSNGCGFRGECHGGLNDWWMDVSILLLMDVVFEARPQWS